MKQFWIKNKVLLITLCAVLMLGVAFWGGLRLFEGNQMRDVLVRTSAAEAEAAAAPADLQGRVSEEAAASPMPPADPTPSPLPAEIPAEVLEAQAKIIRQELLHTERRYQSILPQISSTVPYEAKTWKEGTEVKNDLAAAARNKAKEIYEKLLGRELDPDDITVTQYWDKAGYRENILRLSSEKNDFVCVLAEKDLGLLIADNAVFAGSEKLDHKKDAERVAEYLGTTITGLLSGRGGGSNRDGSWVEQVTAYELSDGRWISLAYVNRTLHGVQVHPDYYSMQEMTCFQADIRISPEVVHLVAPANFVQGRPNEPAEGDMTVDQVALMYRAFLSAANGRAAERRDAEGKTMEELDYNLKDWEITYFLDKSGYRENYYHIHKDGLVDMDIAAKSGYIVRATCNGLYNPDDDLKLINIDYDHMGGTEYIHYVKYVAEQTFGKENVKEVDVNAVYDGNFCTIDAYMVDGRWYEFCFAGGRLMEIQHYATERSGIMGWGADSLYVNTVTGEEFYEEW